MRGGGTSPPSHPLVSATVCLLLQNQIRHRLDAHDRFCRLHASLLPNCITLGAFIKLYQVCVNQARYNLIFISLVSRKHHLNLLLQSFRSVSLDLHQCFFIVIAGEDTSLRTESFTKINLRGVSAKLNLRYCSQFKTTKNLSLDILQICCEFLKQLASSL